MPKIAISYRRADSSAMAGRIFDTLASHYGGDSVFMDIDKIPPGVDFRQFIESSLNETDVLVAVIGPRWLGRGRGGPRIMDEFDPVRVEVETALKAQKIVIPVLIEHATMPKPADLPESLRALSHVNASEVATGRDFHAHMDRLIAFLDSRLYGTEAKQGTTNIREPNTSFVGRTREIAELTEALTHNRLTTLCGPGGVGKTRIALEVAKEARTHYRDGVWFVEFAPVSDPELTVDAVAAALGIRSDSRTPIGTALRARQMLLVFDNCEHLLRAISPLAQNLIDDCPDVQILATSREPLGIEGEELYRIDPFDTPPSDSKSLKPAEAERFDSIRLFVERARSADKRFALTEDNASTVASICSRLDGIPLAIEIAAARINVVSLDDLLRRLGDRLQLARRASSRAAARHATLQATIDWSHSLLTATEQALFRRLAIFAGGWSLDAATTVCCDDATQESGDGDVLASLVDKSLVTLDVKGSVGRYNFLETTREYAFQRLGESGEETDYRRRHAEWNATFADLAYESSWTSPQPHWLARIMPEMENVRAALHWGLEDNKDLEKAARIAGGLVPLWQARSLGEGRRYIESIQERWTNSGDQMIEALLWTGLASTTVAKRRVDAAARAEQIHDSLSDNRGLADDLRIKAEGLRQMQQLDEAKSSADRALTLFERHSLQNSSRYPALLQTFASILDDLGRKDEARTAYHDALRRLEAIGDQASLASAKIQLADLEFAAGNVSEALSLAEDARSALVRVGDVAKQTAVMVNLAAYHIMVGELPDARVEALEALDLALAVDEPLYVAIALQHVGTIAALTGDSGRGALLLNYVDRWYRDEDFEREGTEQKTYELGLSAVRKTLSANELADANARGARSSQEEAVLEARR